MVRFSNPVLAGMGFRKFAETEAISASFSSVTVYEARGVLLEPNTTEVSAGRVAGVDYQLAVSAGVNDACLSLMADVFTDDEDKWRREQKCTGPFVLLRTGPTSEHKCISGHLMDEEDGSLTTFDSFPAARDELAQLESRAHPSIVTGLTCVLNEQARYVRLRKIARESVGQCTDGRRIRDIHLEGFSAEAYVSRKLERIQLVEKLESARNLASDLNPKSSRFFALGLAEEDELKRFLYFFLSIEVETHAVFGRINQLAAIGDLLDGAAPPGESLKVLLHMQVSALRNLFDRFVWCAARTWLNLDESDIAQFKQLKGARDAIAHGSAAEPPPGFARQAELLAHKVLWRPE